MPVTSVVGCAWASYARDASRTLRLGLLMPAIFVAGCAWASHACRLRWGSYACVGCRRLRLVMLLDVALGFPMPLTLLAGCAWASYACFSSSSPVQAPTPSTGW